MKRIIAIILVAVTLLGMSACGGKNPSTPTADPQQTTQNPKPTDGPTAPPATVPSTQPPVTVIVTLDPAGGVCAQTQLLLTQGDCYGVLPVPALDGYVFLGWFTEPKAGEQITEQTLLISS